MKKTLLIALLLVAAALTVTLFSQTANIENRSNLSALATTTPGTGVATALGINVGSAGAPVLFNGALGTPSSGTGTNITGLPLGTGVTGVLPLANGGTACATPYAINPQTATYQALAADFTCFKTITVASGTFTITLVANTSQPAAGTWLKVINYGSGVVTIARSGQNLNGGVTSLTLGAASATAPTVRYVHSDGTNYFLD